MTPRQEQEKDGEALAERLRVALRDQAEARGVLEWVELAADGETVSDFGLSFPLVRKVADLWLEQSHARDLEARITELEIDRGAATVYAKACDARLSRIETAAREVVACMKNAAPVEPDLIAHLVGCVSELSRALGEKGEEER